MGTRKNLTVMCYVRCMIVCTMSCQGGGRSVDIGVGEGCRWSCVLCSTVGG